MVPKLTRILGINWTVSNKGPQIDAYRVPRQLPVEGFDARIDAEKRALQLRESGTTVDFAEGNIHLAGTANRCGDVVEAARRFATIHGVNGIIIDTDCSPRQ